MGGTFKAGLHYLGRPCQDPVQALVKTAISTKEDYRSPEVTWAPAVIRNHVSEVQ